MEYTSPNLQIENNLQTGKSLYISAGSTLQQIKSDLDSFGASLQTEWIGDGYDAYKQKQEQLAKAVQAGSEVLQKGSVEIGKMYDAYLEADEKQRQELQREENSKIIMGIFIVVTALLVVVAPILELADLAFEAGMLAADEGGVELSEVAQGMGDNVASDMLDVDLNTVDDSLTNITPYNSPNEGVVSETSGTGSIFDTSDTGSMSETSDTGSMSETSDTGSMSETSDTGSMSNKVEKGKAVDRGPEPQKDPNVPDPSTQEDITTNPDGSTTMTKVEVDSKMGTRTVTETTTRPNGSTEIKTTEYDDQGNVTGSEVSKIDGPRRTTISYDAQGKQIGETDSVKVEGRTLTSIYDGKGTLVGRSVEENGGNETRITTFDGQNNYIGVSIERPYGEKGWTSTTTQVRQSDGSWAETTTIKDEKGTVVSESTIDD